MPDIRAPGPAERVLTEIDMAIDPEAGGANSLNINGYLLLRHVQVLFDLAV